MITFEEFSFRAQAVEARIAAAARIAGRDPASVRLLPVTKTHPVEAALYAARRGFLAVGENRVQEAASKRLAMVTKQAEAGEARTLGLRWELIGHLQSNKAKSAVETFDCIQSVDSEKLARLLNRAAGELGRSLAVLLQVNAGRDPAKFGCELEDAPRLLETALGCAHLRVEGLMTIAPLGGSALETAELAARTFANLRSLRDDLASRLGVALPELSMGMSGDLDAAVAAGSTCVRVGSALFGAR
ncbi:MAG: YggS family pyridoxal phosphate-dependent enzyme [Verrucomicrobia bacterium]|nr:MAG: YggS family pyridoxal phosphate-dependent enzyme [Verrucomicrobiota bacterium]